MKIGKMMTTALWIIVAELGVLILLFLLFFYLFFR